MGKFTSIVYTFIVSSFLVFTATSTTTHSAIQNKFQSASALNLEKKFSQSYSKGSDIRALKEETLKLGGSAVPVLIEVMKNGKYPEKNRWAATFLLGQIMGEKSSPFIVKFTEHPNWLMRMASLKTLLKLKEKRFGVQYAKLLQDQSLIVRTQALENIRQLSLNQFAPQVWSMLYDKKNYYEPTVNGKIAGRKRANIIKNVVMAIGDLKFQDARAPMIKMIQKEKYKDIFPELDYALGKITGKSSPAGDLKKKRFFWSREAFNVTI